MNAEFQENGYVIHRGLVDLRTVYAWGNLYASLADPERKPEFNPVAVNAPDLQPLLTLIASHPPILAKVREIWGDDIAVYNQRFVVKDKHSRGPVMWHQDTGYHQGWPQKCSVFVAMSQVEPERGGLIIARGSHHYGFMGDAGELNIDVLPESQHSRMDIRMIAGDVLIMHSACWHSSHAHTSGADRVLSDVIYQPASDCVPEFLRKPFIRSRVDRIKELERK
jgi:ectoine hydroxylase-related dioxygenase (phytanoyl-CoA dioxygenase family)